MHGFKISVKFYRIPSKFRTKVWIHTPQNMHFTDLFLWVIYDLFELWCHMPWWDNPLAGTMRSRAHGPRDLRGQQGSISLRCHKPKTSKLTLWVLHQFHCWIAELIVNMQIFWRYISTLLFSSKICTHNSYYGLLWIQIIIIMICIHF